MRLGWQVSNNELYEMLILKILLKMSSLKLFSDFQRFAFKNGNF